MGTEKYTEHRVPYCTRQLIKSLSLRLDKQRMRSERRRATEIELALCGYGSARRQEMRRLASTRY